MIRHTVFTPVYNRAGCMQELYKSIEALDYPRDKFEWIIVDDGSTDDLKNVVETFKQQSPDLNIRYFYKTNGGIHTAQNYAIREAAGEYVTRIDSDDYLLPDALKLKDYYLERIPKESGPIAGVVGLCLNRSDMSVRGTEFPQEEEITTGIELQKLNVSGDRNYCMKTAIMRQFLLPEYEDTKWVPESVPLWLSIDRHYRTFFVNKPFSVCAEPSMGSVSGQMVKPTLPNCMSKYYSCIHLLNDAKDMVGMKRVVLAYLQLSYVVILADRVAGKNLLQKRVYNDLKSFADKAVITVLRPAGWLYYITKKKKLGL